MRSSRSLGAAPQLSTSAALKATGSNAENAELRLPESSILSTMHCCSPKPPPSDGLPAAFDAAVCDISRSSVTGGKGVLDALLDELVPRVQRYFFVFRLLFDLRFAGSGGLLQRGRIGVGGSHSGRRHECCAACDSDRDRRQCV